VIDASSVLAWCFEDEGGPQADAPIDKVAVEGAAVPDLWFLEIANGLVTAERRGRIKPAESATFVAMLEDLPIVADRATGRALHATMSLAREHRLTAYDAAYLDLAMRLGLPLATDDRSLGAAARRVGIVVLQGAP
jgi:predicted nucleic acid-binding protein